MINYIHKLIQIKFINVKETIIENEEGKFTSYWIEYDGKEIKDISVDKSKIENFASDLNRLGVSEIHIDEVIEDFLAE